VLSVNEKHRPGTVLPQAWWKEQGPRYCNKPLSFAGLNASAGKKIPWLTITASNLRVHMLCQA